MAMERGRQMLSPRPRPRLNLKRMLMLMLMLMPPTAPTVIPVDPGARQELRGSASRGQCRTQDRCQGNTAGRWQLPTMEVMLMADLVDLVDTVASEVLDVMLMVDLVDLVDT